MSDLMRPIPFAQLMNWSLEEQRLSNSIFGVSKQPKHQGAPALPIFGETLEAPFGPAAGPNTQLALSRVLGRYLRNNPSIYNFAPNFPCFIYFSTG